MAAAKVGRKRHSPIWDFFDYDCVNDKNKCLVVEAGDTMCGILLKEKKTHESESPFEKLTQEG